MDQTMRYHHGMIADTVGRERALTAIMDQSERDTLAVLADMQQFWEGMGNNNYQVFQQEVVRRYGVVRADINLHATKKTLASTASQTADHASAASLAR